MTTNTLEVGISSAKRDGQYVAWLKGATFGKEEFPLAIVKEYVILLDDELPVTIRAVDDETAIEFVGAKYIRPYTIVQRTTTIREVGDFT